MMRAFSHETGRPSAQFALMNALAHAERGLGVVEIAEALDVNAAAVTRLVNAMEGERLIRRRADPRDGRRHYVSLTEKGLTQFARHPRPHPPTRAAARGGTRRGSHAERRHGARQAARLYRGKDAK